MGLADLWRLMRSISIRTWARWRRAARGAGPFGRAGFTLLELMIALIVVIALAVASVPTVQAIMGRGLLDKATSGVLELIQFAQRQAANRGRAYGIFVDVGNGDDEHGEVRIGECDDTRCCVEGTGAGFATTIATLTFGERDEVDQEFPTIYVSGFEPSTGLSSVVLGVCLTPDGRMLRATSGTAITPAAVPQDQGLGYGTARLELTEQIPTSTQPDVTPLPPHTIVLTYSGNAYYDRPN